MNLQQIKEEFNRAGMSPAGLAAANAIIDQAIKKGKLEDDGKDELDEIVANEIEAAKIIDAAQKEIAKAVDDFVDGIGGAAAKASEELESIGAAAAMEPPKPDRGNREF